MGYRSEVAVVVKNEDYEKFIKGNSDFKDLMNIAEVTKNEDLVMIYWDWIKWYLEYEDISIIEATMDKLDEQNAPYKFVRIGEDWDDVDVRENWGVEGECDRISVYRGVDIV